MKSFEYEIRLVSDAEPGTGMGGENVNGLAPRDAQQRLKLNGSHIKGLMREQLAMISQSLGWSAILSELLFGVADSQASTDAAIRLIDAVSKSKSVSNITRTALKSDGIKKDGSLRTVEAVPAGTIFAGRLVSHVEDNPVLAAAWRLALLSIPAVGGSRNRGAGACVVSLRSAENVAGTQSDVTGLFDTIIKSKGEISVVQPAAASAAPMDLSQDAIVCLQLTFTAESPICCPEVADKTNALRTGFAIPASAVQGAVLHRLQAVNSRLATATFEHVGFRSWPLLPLGLAETGNVLYRNPVRVGLTHRGAKFSLNDMFTEEHFQDESIKAFDWTKVPDGAPLKAFDGVLLQSDEGVLLWKATQMPHVITAHGVRNDQSANGMNPSIGGFRLGGRNLFSVDSMGLLVWQGNVFLPQQAAAQLIDSLESCPLVAFGKGRSVRGQGRLMATPVKEVPWRSPHAPESFDVLVAQSPLLVSTGSLPTGSAEQALQQMVNDWLQQHGIEAISAVEAWATTSVRFGWNRTTRTATKTDGYAGASLVIDPGSTIKLSGRIPDDKLSCLQRGVGEGRQAGFGAVSLHPGKASRMFDQHRSRPTKQSEPGIGDAVRLALQIAKNPLPSTSQWSTLRRMRAMGSDTAVRYLERQVEERPGRIFGDWEMIERDICKLLQMEDSAAFAGLNLLAHKAADQREARK